MVGLCEGVLEYASNAEAWLARTPALFTRHMHQLTRHCYVIVLQQTSLFSIFRSHDRPRAQINQSQKYAADSPVVISPLYNFTSLPIATPLLLISLNLDLRTNITPEDKAQQKNHVMSFTIWTYAFWHTYSSCEDWPTTVQHNSQRIPPMSKLPLWQINALQLVHQDPSQHDCTPSYQAG